MMTTEKRYAIRDLMVRRRIEENVATVAEIAAAYGVSTSTCYRIEAEYARDTAEIMARIRAAGELT